MHRMSRVSCDTTSVSHLLVMYMRDPTHSTTHGVHVQYTQTYICRSVQYHVTIYCTNVTLTHSNTHCIRMCTVHMYRTTYYDTNVTLTHSNTHCMCTVHTYVQNHISQYKCDPKTVSHTLHMCTVHTYVCTYISTEPHITRQM